MEEFEEYLVRLLPRAYDDIDALFRYIAYEVFAPVPADKYVEGIYNIINSLSYLGGSYAITQNQYIQKLYGPDARTVVYKKMTIVYRLIGNIVLVQRVMASSLIR